MHWQKAHNKVEFYSTLADFAPTPIIRDITAWTAEHRTSTDKYDWCRGEGGARNLWRQVLHHLGGEYAGLAVIKPAVLQDLRKVQL